MFSCHLLCLLRLFLVIQNYSPPCLEGLSTFQGVVGKWLQVVSITYELVLKDASMIFKALSPEGCRVELSLSLSTHPCFW